MRLDGQADMTCHICHCLSLKDKQNEEKKEEERQRKTDELAVMVLSRDGEWQLKRDVCMSTTFDVQLKEGPSWTHVCTQIYRRANTQGLVFLSISLTYTPANTRTHCQPRRK